MLMGRAFCWAPLGLLLAAVPSRAHFHILLPESPSGARDRPVSFTIRWGHPFEHELFDASRPGGLLVVSPDGKQADLGGTLEKTTFTTPDNRKAVGYAFRYTPGRRGDHTFVLTAPPVW